MFIMQQSTEIVIFHVFAQSASKSNAELYNFRQFQHKLSRHQQTISLLHHNYVISQQVHL